MRGLWIAAAVALGAATLPAAASETYTGAAALDQVEASYVRHTREHRMWEIQRNTREAGSGRLSRPWLRLYRRGYGPPPHARAYAPRPRPVLRPLVSGIEEEPGRKAGLFLLRAAPKPRRPRREGFRTNPEGMRGVGASQSTAACRCRCRVDVEQRHRPPPGPARGSLWRPRRLRVRRRTGACLFGPDDERHLHGPEPATAAIHEHRTPPGRTMPRDSPLGRVERGQDRGGARAGIRFCRSGTATPLPFSPWEKAARQGRMRGRRALSGWRGVRRAQTPLIRQRFRAATFSRGGEGAAQRLHWRRSGRRCPDRLEREGTATPLSLLPSWEKAPGRGG